MNEETISFDEFKRRKAEEAKNDAIKKGINIPDEEVFKRTYDFLKDEDLRQEYEKEFKGKIFEHVKKKGRIEWEQIPADQLTEETVKEKQKEAKEKAAERPFTILSKEEQLETRAVRARKTKDLIDRLGGWNLANTGARVRERYLKIKENLIFDKINIDKIEDQSFETTLKRHLRMLYQSGEIPRVKVHHFFEAEEDAFGYLEFEFVAEGRSYKPIDINPVYYIPPEPPEKPVETVEVKEKKGVMVILGPKEKKEVEQLEKEAVEAGEKAKTNRVKARATVPVGPVTVEMPKSRLNETTEEKEEKEEEEPKEEEVITAT